MRLLQVMTCFTEQSLLAFLPFLVFTGLYLLTKQRFIFVVGLCWGVYVPYEFGMKWRILCSGECNIRVDLLIIYPAFWVLSVVSLGMAFHSISQKRST